MNRLELETELAWIDNYARGNRVEQKQIALERMEFVAGEKPEIKQDITYAFSYLALSRQVINCHLSCSRMYLNLFQASKEKLLEGLEELEKAAFFYSKIQPDYRNLEIEDVIKEQCGKYNNLLM